MAEETPRAPGRTRRRRGELGSEVWAVLERADGPLTAREVLQRLSDPLAYTTVVTTLARLHAKGVLTRSRDGRSHRYAPSTTRAGLVARRMQHALDGYEDRRAVLSHFVAELTGEDEQVLRALLAVDRDRR